MANRESLAPEEWYHVYNRGVDKRTVFLDAHDYARFLILMHFATHSQNAPLHASEIKDKTVASVLLDVSIDLSEPIVTIGSYCLMPNHVHIALKATKDGGISLFMQRLFTGYTMYFNKKYHRTGALFAGTFKSKHVANDRYFKYLTSYIHLNPAELFEPQWKEGVVTNMSNLKKQLLNYKYSSLLEYLKIKRPENALIDNAVFKLFDEKEKPTLKEMLREASEYYQEYFKSSQG